MQSLLCFVVDERDDNIRLKVRYDGVVRQGTEEEKRVIREATSLEGRLAY